MMTEAGFSLADIAAVTRNNDYDGGMYGQMWNNPFVYLVWMWAMRGFNGGWDNNGMSAATQGALTRSDMYEGFNSNNIMRKLDGLENGLCDGFYAQNTNLLQGFNGLQRDLCQGFGAVSSGIAENRFAAQQCCCEVKGAIAENRFEASRNTCEITNAIHAEGEATRALINHNTMQELRDRLEQRDRDILTRDFQISQYAQTQNLIDTLKPCARPAYLTCSPYTSIPYPTNTTCGAANYGVFA